MSCLKRDQKILSLLSPLLPKILKRYINIYVRLSNRHALLKSLLKQYKWKNKSSDFFAQSVTIPLQRYNHV